MEKLKFHDWDSVSPDLRMKDEASESLIEGSEVSRHAERRFKISTGFLAHCTLTLFLLCTSIFFALRQRPAAPPSLQDGRTDSYETGFSTEFVSNDPPIPISTIRKHFTNDLHYNNSSGSLYNSPLTPNETVYVGPPSLSIDSAWHSLLHAQYFALLPSETSQIPPSHLSSIFYNGAHNFIEFAVFHNLHCLNEIREALDGEYYGMKDDKMHEGRAHLDHCVDQIRQALMCHGDLTPVPMMEVDVGKGKGKLYVGNGEEHTCRDFEAIWGWVEERGMKLKALGE